MEFDEELVQKLMRAMPVGDLLADGDAEAAIRRRGAALQEVAWPDLETVMVGSAGGLTGEFRGRAGFEEAWIDWLEPFEAYSSELVDVRVAPSDRLVVITRQRATPRGSAAVIERDAAGVLMFRDGRLARIEFHLEPATALRAAGLEP